MAPIVRQLRPVPQVYANVCITAQYRQLLDQVLHLVGIRPDYDRIGDNDLEIFTPIFGCIMQPCVPSMITIRPIHEEEIPAAKRVILTVAYHIFGFEGSLEDSIHQFLAAGKLKEMDDLHASYFNAGGTFLVALNGEQVIIGSGALRRLDEETAELKRMWLLEAYHGQGIGYRLITQLFDFAREQGYTRVRLQTSPQQVRALAFYRKVGFYEIPCYNEGVGEISMEVKLETE